MDPVLCSISLWRNKKSSETSLIKISNKNCQVCRVDSFVQSEWTGCVQITWTSLMDVVAATEI